MDRICRQCLHLKKFGRDGLESRICSSCKRHVVYIRRRRPDPASGDSWSDLGFNLSGPYPNPGSPFGNPTFPSLNESYGAYWPVYLTTQYNASVIETYAVVRGSSLINNTIQPSRSDLIQQVRQEFLPLWGSRNATTWQPDDTLFLFFLGINDIGIVVESPNNLTTTLDGIMATYSSLVDEVCCRGLHHQCNHV